MIEAIYRYGLDKIDEIQTLRNQCQEQQGLIQGLYLDFDDEAYHVIAYEGGMPIAVGRLINQMNMCYVDHIYVISEKRGQNFGDLVVKMLIDKAFRLGVKQVFVQSPQHTKRFFENIGFVNLEDESSYGNMYIQKEMIHKCKH